VNKEQSSRFLLVAATGYLIVRVILLFNPGHISDLDLYREWLVKAGQFGVAQIYRTSRMDYPPFYAYILAPLGWIYELTSKFNIAGPVLLTVLVKLPPTLFDLGTAGVLWRYMNLKGVSVSGSSLVAATYLLNPAVLFDIAFWGQPDSIHSFFILAGFATIGYGTRFWCPFRHSRSVGGDTLGICLAWGSIALATLMKPLGLPSVPLLLFLSVLLFGVRGAIVGVTAAVAVGLAVFAPFLLAGEGGPVFKRVFSDIGAMPFTSANAHNLWWAAGAWRDSETPLIGPLTATHLGLALFGLAYVSLCWSAYWRHKSQGGQLLPSQMLALAAMINFSFFIFSTHLHENHLFAVVALLSALTLEHRVWRNLFICVSLGVFINCWLHDYPMDHPHWPYTIGGPTRILHPPYFDRVYYVGELAALWASVVFNLAVYTLAMVGTLRGGAQNWLARLYVSEEEHQREPGKEHALA